MLKKSQKDPESRPETGVTAEVPDLVPFGDAVGCLAIHVKACGDISPMNFKSVMVRISVNNIVKSTKVCSLSPQFDENNAIINFDELKYFSIKIPRRQDDKRNNISLELLEHLGQHFYVLGRTQIHLYKVIEKGYFTEEFQMFNQNMSICRLEVEFVFSYGNFGFGFSHQLKPFRRVTSPSMFMSVTPPPERTDPITNVITPQSTEYPEFLSPDLDVAVGKPTVTTQASQQPVVQLEKLKQPPRERLQRMKKEYRNLNSWIDKVNYLERILNSNSEDKLKAINSSEKPKDIITPEKKKEEITPVEEQYEDDLKHSTSKTDEPKLREYSPVFNIPNLIVTEDSKVAPLMDYPSEEDMPYETDEQLFHQEYMEDSYPFSSEDSLSSLPIAYEDLNAPDSEYNLAKQNTCGQKNTNKKGKLVDFLPEKDLPCLSQECVKINSTYSKLNNQDGFEPFLRDINNKISLKKSKDQDMLTNSSSPYSDVVEHEDQDPPYPAQSKPVEPKKVWNQAPEIISVDDPNPKLAHDPDITTGYTSDMENELACEPLYTTVQTLDDKSAFKEIQPNESLPNIQGESSVTENVNAGCPPQSESLCLMSHMEELKQSMVLKSILSKDLQDLSDKLFSEPEILLNTAASPATKSSSLIQTVQDKPPSDLEDKIIDKSKDLDSWIPEQNISKSLLSSTDSLSKDESGNIPLVEKDLDSDKNIPSREEDFPVKKKKSFKTKHLESELSSSKSGLNDIVYDYDIKKLFIAPSYSSYIGESNETQKQLSTDGENLSSDILLHYAKTEDEIQFPQAKSIISQIIQAFPIDILLECGLIKVVELDNEYHKNFLLDSETDFDEENLTDSKTESFQEQNIPIIPKETTSSINRIQFTGKGQNMSPQYSKYKSTPDKNTSLPSSSDSLYRKENYIRYLEHLSNSLTGKLGVSDIALMSFLKAIFNVYFKYCQSEGIRPEKDLERLVNRYFLNNTDFEEVKENFDKVGKLDQESILSSKLCVFLEELSESEIKNLKSELSKHIQHYLIERLLESGHINKEDLPKIYQNLYLMNEKKEPKGQSIFLEKYSGTIEEVISFVNNFNRHFIDKHLEIKLRSFLTEILQNYFLKHFSESSLLKEIESKTLHLNLSSLRTKRASLSSYEIRQNISRGSFGRRPEIKMKYSLNKSLQNYLKTLSENELLNIQANLSKRLYCLWIKKLSKPGLITERQLESDNLDMNLINSSATQLKSIKSDLCCKDENQSMKEYLENQDKYPEVVQNTKISEDKLTEREAIGKEEKKSNPLYNVKENPSVIEEQKIISTEETKPLDLELQTSNNNSQVIALNMNSSEGLTDKVLRKQRKEHGIPEIPKEENVGLKTEIQDPCNGSGKSKPVQSNACFERMLKTKSLDKKEQSNFCRLLIQRNTDAILVAYPRIPSCKMSNEDKECANKCPFHFRQSNTIYCTSEFGDKSKLDDHYQRWKGNNNNNKKQPLVIFGQYKKEIQTVYPKVLENSSEKYARFFESHPFKYKKIMKTEKSSKSFLFPELLKTEHLKPKIRKERDHYSKQKKSLSKIGRVLPSTMPTTRNLLRKSVPKTMLHWTARRTIHDCSDRFEELPENAFQHFERVKPRAKLLGKSPDDSRHHLKHSGRPYTAPEMNKRRDNYAGRYTNSRMSSTSSFQTNDLAQDFEFHKMQQKKIRREY